MELKKQSRNYGLDLMKIISMMMVIVLHINMHGGVYDALPDGTLKKYIVLFGEIICLCAVNCFAIISGYTGWRSTGIKPFRILKIWGMCAFFSLFFTLSAVYLKVIPFSLKAILLDIFPICSGEYWYITAYVGMYIISPLINKAIQQLDSEIIRKVSFLLIGFVIISSFFGSRDPLKLNEGYSFVWLSIMYFLGGVIGKYRLTERISVKRGVLYLVLCDATAFIAYVVSHFIIKNNRYEDAIPVLRYDGFFMILNAIFMLAIFEKIRFSENKKNIIEKIIPFNLGVYVIHVNPIVWDYITKERFVFVTEYNSFLIVIMTILLTLLIYNICIFIEFLRSKIFAKHLILKKIYGLCRTVYFKVNHVLKLDRA